MPAYKKITDYLTIKELISNGDEFHTDVNVVKKIPDEAASNRKVLPQKYKNIWYLKQDDDAGDALREVLAQELFRLFIPNQPKTRLVEDYKGEPQCVASKGVPGYRSLKEYDMSEINRCIKDGSIYGLGDIVVMAMMVNEVDLRIENLCLDDHDQLIKIDGDRCFARIFGEDFKNKKYNITERELARLPFIKDYYAYNWLDLILQDKRQRHTHVIDGEITRSPLFRHEVNRSIMKLLVMPNKLTRDFMGTITFDQNETNLYCADFNSRLKQLKSAALKNKSFCQYIHSAQAVTDLQTYVDYLNTFTTTGKNTLHIEHYEKQIRSEYLLLKNSVPVNGGNRSVKFFAAVAPNKHDLRSQERDRLHQEKNEYMRRYTKTKFY